VKLPADFEKTLAEKPAEELCEMLANAEDYLPEAIEAARAELGRRELPEANVATMVQSATAQRVAEEAEYRDGPLDMRIVILIFGLWVGVGCFLYYRAKGCRKKSRQSLLWILYHVGAVFGLVVLSFTVYSLGLGR
jgi:hypothetical protein